MRTLRGKETVRSLCKEEADGTGLSRVHESVGWWFQCAVRAEGLWSQVHMTGAGVSASSRGLGAQNTRLTRG